MLHVRKSESPPETSHGWVHACMLSSRLVPWTQLSCRSTQTGTLHKYGWTNRRVQSPVRLVINTTATAAASSTTPLQWMWHGTAVLVGASTEAAGVRPPRPDPWF